MMEINDRYTYAHSDAIDNRITEVIAQNPGALTSEIAAAAGITKERARYRLMTLELQKRVYSVKERKLRRYFVNASHVEGQ